jgi:hypothetical protein
MYNIIAQNFFLCPEALIHSCTVHTYIPHIPIIHCTEVHDIADLLKAMHGN